MSTSAVAYNNTSSFMPVGINQSDNINLNRMVNLALNSSPSVGIVNFNILKSFLLELLNALNLQNFEPKFGGNDEIKNLIDDALKNETDQDSFLKSTGIGDKDNQTGNTKSNISILTSDMKPLTLDRFQSFEDKIIRLENQITALNTLPSSQQIIQKSKDTKSRSSGPILEIWQYTQLSKRQESNEEGITKLTSILQDLINEMNDLKEMQQNMMDEMKGLKEKNDDITNSLSKLESLSDLLPTMNEDINAIKNELNNFKMTGDKMDMLNKKVNNDQNKGLKDTKINENNDQKIIDKRNLATTESKDEVRSTDTENNNNTSEIHSEGNELAPNSSFLENRNDMENKLLMTATHEDLNKYVRWNDLENKLRGSKSKSINDDQMPGGKLQIDPEFEDLLSKLGTVNTRHEKLEDLVDKLRIEMGKNSTPDLPADFKEKMDELLRLKSKFDELKNNFDDRNVNVDKSLSKINEDIEALKKSLSEMLENFSSKDQDFKALRDLLDALSESKIDKSLFQSEIKNKADVKDLSKKLNKQAFDEFNNELSNNVKNVVLRSDAMESDIKLNNDNIAKELDNKLDRLEIDALKDYMDKQLKRMKKLQKDAHDVQPTIANVPSEDDAAGLRKQLLRFHCISCDRPIDVNNNQAPIPSLPSERGMRPIQTPRPYTTYELDQIRQFQKQQFLQETSYDLFSTVRQCGGSHTLTIPHKKVLKNSNELDVAQPVQNVQNPTTKTKTEVQIQGQDGQIYKGRLDAKLNVELKRPKDQRNRLKSAAPILEHPKSPDDSNEH